MTGKRREEGFTTVELMIVIGIIGILVSIAMVSFVFATSSSRKATCHANLKIIRDQLIVYYCMNDDDPPTLEDLVPGFVDDEDSLYCPETGAHYDYDPLRGEVSCSFHTDL